jgi:hypothetical protein
VESKKNQLKVKGEVTEKAVEDETEGIDDTEEMIRTNKMELISFLNLKREKAKIVMFLIKPFINFKV